MNNTNNNQLVQFHRFCDLNPSIVLHNIIEHCSVSVTVALASTSRKYKELVEKFTDLCNRKSTSPSSDLPTLPMFRLINACRKLSDSINRFERNISLFEDWDDCSISRSLCPKLNQCRLLHLEEITKNINDALLKDETRLNYEISRSQAVIVLAFFAGWIRTGIMTASFLLAGSLYNSQNLLLEILATAPFLYAFAELVSVDRFQETNKRRDFIFQLIDTKSTNRQMLINSFGWGELAPVYLLLLIVVFIKIFQ